MIVRRHLLSVVLLVTLLGAGALRTNAVALDDEVPEFAEVRAGTDPHSTDTDGDGLDDGAEPRRGSDPNDADSDGDGIDDGTERGHGSDQAELDTDGDGIDDGEEIAQGTDPAAPDTDGDGLTDREELEVHSSDPTDRDTDADGVTDAEEVSRYDTDPAVADTDGDGLADGREVSGVTAPTEADTDDGLDDGTEAEVGTDPEQRDTDGDGLSDGDEVALPALSAADPLQMDVFVELDWVAGERPDSGTIAAVVEASDDAPVSNPDGTTGVNLHVVFSNSVPYHPETDSEKLQSTMGAHMAYDGCGYRYALAVEDTDSADSMGYALSGRNEPFAFKTDARPGYYYPDGSIRVAFMHELGHSLGLSSYAYGGIDSTEVDFDSYSSVMNYNAPTHALRYNTGGPFDDWEYVTENLRTPPVSRESCNAGADTAP